MATISPSIVTLGPGETQQFLQTGITTPFWTLEGLGALNTSGFYTAPGTLGSEIVRVGDTIWGTLGSNVAKNADDTLDVTGAGADYSYMAPILNNVGDYLEWDYFTGMDILLFGGGDRFWWRSDGLFFCDPAGVDGSTPSMSPGDVGRLERISSTQIGAKKNGTLIHTFSTTYSGALTTGTYIAAGLMGTTVPKPRVGGTGVTGYTEAQAAVTIAPALLVSKTGLEIYCQADTLGLSNDDPVTSFTDLSGKGRHLEPVSNAPLFKTSDDFIQFDGSTTNPLKSDGAFSITCGFIIAKYDDATFPNDADGYKGLLTGTLNELILAGEANATRWFDFVEEFYEFRCEDRIYPNSNAPAPMAAWKLIFFRFWRPITVQGIQIGQDRMNTARKWKGGVKLLALYSTNKCEAEIRSDVESLADYYEFTLADVYPYQADRSSTESPEQSVNFYDPPEGDRISEVIGNSARVFELKFSSRRKAEIQAMKIFHSSHYPGAVPCILRNYSLIPPEDIEGYIDSQYELQGSVNNYQYGFRFKEKP